MALNKEDKADVKNAMGKAMANKVAKVTKDSVNKRSVGQLLRHEARRLSEGGKKYRDRGLIVMEKKTHKPWHKDAKEGFPKAKKPESVFGKALGKKLMERRKDKFKIVRKPGYRYSLEENK